MTPQPALSDESISIPAFAQRVALSVLALEIDELLHRSGGESFTSRISSFHDPASRHATPPHPQPTPSS